MPEHFHEHCKCGEHCQCGDKIQQQCGCKDGECHCAENFLKIADEAWVELLKEKIKAEIEKNKGAEIEKLAKIVAKANKDKWHHKLSAKMECEEYKNNLKDFFTSK